MPTKSKTPPAPEYYEQHRDASGKFDAPPPVDASGATEDEMHIPEEELSPPTPRAPIEPMAAAPHKMGVASHSTMQPTRPWTSACPCPKWPGCPCACHLPHPMSATVPHLAGCKD
jgi:hypothetical protein